MARVAHGVAPEPPLYGLLAEFETADAVLAAAGATYAAGYRKINAYTPFPVHGLSQALRQPRSILPWLVLAGGVIGCSAGYFLQYYAHVISYPVNIGGRPAHSWPSFIPITFELTVLGAAFTAFLGMLALNGLPHPHHPLFSVPAFSLASRDKFFLCIQTRDPLFDIVRTREFLQSSALHVYEVPS